MINIYYNLSRSFLWMILGLFLGSQVSAFINSIFQGTGIFVLLSYIGALAGFLYPLLQLHAGKNQLPQNYKESGKIKLGLDAIGAGHFFTLIAIGVIVTMLSSPPGSASGIMVLPFILLSLLFYGLGQNLVGKGINQLEQSNS